MVNKNLMLSFLNYLYVVSFTHLFAFPVSGSITTETFFIYCGSSQNYTASDGRNWIGDVSSNFLPVENAGASTTYQAPEERVFNPPFASARLSHSEFTYRFPVTSGPKYIRLYFNPYSYESFHRSKASFSVKTGGYTLLCKFNASLAADALDSLTIFKEFVINCQEDQMLNITFTPMAGDPDAYAFINGIEVVSMPDYLYYTSPLEGGFQFIGQKNSFSIETDLAMETVYRLNVGGNSVSPMNDTGMFRTWDADDKYCTRPGFVPPNTRVDLKFTQIPNYTAPVDVYQTARTMGNNKTENMGYNLTWVFPVDSGFSYLLRLHFCEFQPEIQHQHDREFSILISNETAEKHADVITWSGGNGIPIFRDYGIMMPSQGSNKKENIYIQLHPNPEYRTTYSDAILNGIELFKLSNVEHELAVDLDIPPAVAQPTSRESIKMKLVAIIGSAVGAVVAVPILCFFVVHQMRRNRDPGLRDRALCLAPIKSSHTHRSSLTSDLCCHFSLQEIKTATNNFDKGFIIGEGGFGSVYKGYINGGTTTVAIKRLNPDSQQGAHEFMTEIEMLSQFRHIHLVSLIGYCNHKREMILVYEYMAKGNLRDHLYNTDNPPLRWTQRLKICIGAARGLHYLHAGVKKPIIHRDVKTTNILLDHKWGAKVSDFGLSKMSPTSVANANISTVVKGSFGYLDPEYFRFQRLNEKSDVYSFGVVLFEVLCARPPVNQTGEEEQAGLAHWAVSSYKNGKLEEIMDPHLKGEIAPLCLDKYTEIAVSCVLDQRINRPSMSDVVRGLELALEIQESTEKGNTLNHEEEDLSQISATTDDDDKDVFHNGGGDVSNSEASKATIRGDDENEKSSISVTMEDHDTCVLLHQKSQRVMKSSIN